MAGIEPSFPACGPVALLQIQIYPNLKRQHVLIFPQLHLLMMLYTYGAIEFTVHIITLLPFNKLLKGIEVKRGFRDTTRNSSLYYTKIRKA